MPATDTRDKADDTPVGYEDVALVEKPTQNTEESIGSAILACTKHIANGQVVEAYEICLNLRNQNSATYARYNTLMTQVMEKHNLCMDTQQRMRTVDMLKCVRAAGCFAAYSLPAGRLRPTADEHPAAVLVDGIIDAPLFELFHLMHEVGLYSEWLDAVGDSYVIEDAKGTAFTQCMWVLLQSAFPLVFSDRDACVMVDFFDALDDASSPFLMWVMRDMWHDRAPRIAREDTIRASFHEVAIQFIPLRNNAVRVRVLCEINTHNPMRRFMGQTASHWLVAGRLFSALDAMAERAKLVRQRWDSSLRVQESLKISKHKAAIESNETFYANM